MVEHPAPWGREVEGRRRLGKAEKQNQKHPKNTDEMGENDDTKNINDDREASKKLHI